MKHANGDGCLICGRPHFYFIYQRQTNMVITGSDDWNKFIGGAMQGTAAMTMMGIHPTAFASWKEANTRLGVTTTTGTNTDAAKARLRLLQLRCKG